MRNLRNLFFLLFGALSNDALIIHVDGQDWVSAKSICNLLGLTSEYSLVQNQWATPELNLTDEDKLKFHVPQAHRGCPIWFVSEAGFWKIIARSHTPQVKIFRATFFTEILPRMYREQTNLRD